MLNMMIRKKDIYYYIVILLCILDLNCFYLLDNSNKLLGIPYADFVFFLEILFTVVVVIKFKAFKKGIFNDFFSKTLLFSIPLCFLSAYAATRTYNQPFILGISSQHLWMGPIFLYFALKTLFKVNIITIDRFFKSLKKIVFIYSLVCILQYFLKDIVTFTYVITDERYNWSRYFFSITYLVFYAGVELDKYFKYKNISSNITSLIYIGGVLFISGVVTKGRMGTTTFIVTLVVCILLRRKFNYKKLILIVIGIMAIGMFLSTSIGEDILNIIKGNESVADTGTVRTLGKSYYLNLLLKDTFTFLIGCGSPNVNWNLAQQIVNPLAGLGGTARLYLSDVGILSPFVMYGFIGILWWITIIIVCIKRSWKIFKEYNETVYLQFAILEIIKCTTLVPELFNSQILFIFYLALLENKYIKIKINKIKKNN